MAINNDADSKLDDEMSSIPLADDDPHAIITEDTRDISDVSINHSLDSIQSSFATETVSPSIDDPLRDSDVSPDEQEEKARLISQVLELQNTLDDLSQRVDGVKEENMKLKSENQVLGQYIENLMAASSVFQSTSPKARKSSSKGKN